MTQDLTKDERLALLEAFSKRLKPALDEAKEEARESLLKDFHETHTDRRAILVKDEKVGEVGISYSTPGPCIMPGKTAEALDFLQNAGLVTVEPARGWESRFEKVGDSVVFKDTGEVVGWAEWRPKAPKAASVRGCKPADVLRAFGNQLPDIAGLLED